MKKQFILVVFLLISVSALAQSFALQSGYPKQFGDGLEYYFVATSQDSGSISSNIMTDLVNFDGDFTSYPLAFDILIDTLSANDEIIEVILQGKTGRGVWMTLDTLVTSDTLNGSHTSLTASAAKGTLTLNGWRSPYLRLMINATHADGNAYTVKCSIYAYKRN